MLVLVHLSPAALDHEAARAALFELALDNEVVLVVTFATVVVGILPALAGILPRFRIVALAVQDELAEHERFLVKDLLGLGHVPLILAGGQPTDWSWLGADVELTLPL